jgi:hypothetical protein
MRNQFKVQRSMFKVRFVHPELRRILEAERKILHFVQHKL